MKINITETKNQLARLIPGVRFSGKNQKVYCENLNYSQTQHLADFLYRTNYSLGK